MDMSAAMLRWLPVPQPVRVDPRAVLVLPRGLTTAGECALGVRAGGLDLQLREQWVPGTAYRWVRLNFGLWIAQVEISYRSFNGQLELPLRQWVHQGALEPLEAGEDPRENSHGDRRSRPWPAPAKRQQGT